MIDERNHFYDRVAVQSHPNNSDTVAQIQPGSQFAVIDESWSCYYLFVDAGYDTKGRPGRFVLLCGFVRSSTGHPNPLVMSRLYESHTIQEILRSCLLIPVALPAEQAIDLNIDATEFIEDSTTPFAPDDMLACPTSVNIPLNRAPSESMFDLEPVHVGDSKGKTWPSRDSDTKFSVVDNTTSVGRHRNVATGALGNVRPLRRLRAANSLLAIVLLSIVAVLFVRVYFMNPEEYGLRL